MTRRSPPPALIGLGVVLLVATVAALLIRPDPDDVEAFFDGGGALGPVLFALAYAGLTILLFPAAPLTIAAGALFGVAGGAAVSVVGATAGALGAYWISRLSTRESVARVRGERLEGIEARLRGKGLLALLLLRLIPVVPFNALNYAAGASSIGARDFFIATAVGIIPGAVLYAAIGAGLGSPTSPLFVIAIVAAIALALLTRQVSRRGAPAMDAEDAPGGEPEART